MLSDMKDKIKEHILDELMEAMDDHEGSKLKPKEAMLSITEIKPKHEDDLAGLNDENDDRPDIIERSGKGIDGSIEDDGDDDKDDLSPEDIRDLLKAYSK